MTDPNNQPLRGPDSLEMLDKFGATLVDSDPMEGYFAFERQDASGMSLLVSWHLIERSVQVKLILHDRDIMTLCQEGATAIRIETGDSPALVAEFRQGRALGRLRCIVVPELKVTWSSLNDDGWLQAG